VLNDEIQYFILRFNAFHYFLDTTERHIWGLKGCPKARQRHADFQITLVSSIIIGHYHTCYHSLNAPLLILISIVAFSKDLQPHYNS
jgi:hypothetical protein